MAGGAAAGNRRGYHRSAIVDAAGFKSKLWRVAGWIAAEGRRRPDAEKDMVVDELMAIAEKLNGRNADDGE